MKTQESLYQIDGHDAQLVSRLLELPHKILCHHDVDGLEQLVLHELGHDQHFGLEKAGYFIDNPDFDCLKGIAGYCKSECKMHKDNLWNDPRSFVQDMQKAQFHQQLSHYLDHSLSHNELEGVKGDALVNLGQKLGMGNPSFITWKMKHGNNGILLYEENPAHARRRDLLQHFVALLSLC